MNRGMSGDAHPDVPIASASHDLVVALPVRPEAAGAARRLLAREGLDADLDHTVALLVSELVTNSIRHAAEQTDRIVLAARMTDDWVRVEVRDSGPGFDPDVRNETRGYGLRMLDMLASRWGVDRDDQGTRVWFEVDRRRRRFQRRSRPDAG
jgi:anti-sigma regulatory factor (Ser/Thr protein kinase)